MAGHQTAEQVHELRLLLRLKWRQNFCLYICHRRLHARQSLQTLWCQHEQFASAIHLVSEPLDPTLAFQAADHRTRGRRIESDTLGQGDLIHTRRVQQGVQYGELNRCDTDCSKVFIEQCHRNLMRPPDQVPRGGCKIKAVVHVEGLSIQYRVITSLSPGTGSYSKRA